MFEKVRNILITTTLSTKPNMYYGNLFARIYTSYNNESLKDQ